MCNERAIRNYCKDGKLQTGMMLISWQMPNCQQSPPELEQPNLGPRWLLKREQPPRAGDAGKHRFQNHFHRFSSQKVIGRELLMI